ncbi:nuclear transcription factor Y subunit A-7-like isoform X2 [Carica papaya]|uniref:nuclear transcription factor Y subunit A-7-like isoform X2 n=1 Tax=Carica papaya TaxID=3649 RepID=UPI000B8C8F5E|nr:nuclear transcription factor Y subunit A-7-like isoform X2 [Carica papaya]XP_021903691.1 nuclear transcription factor Y subunit A-7-like isoform X2 [Carica papaya]XP_021903692.1 nuclear transcription factor Y subunit A-7-like isoform X2 [Carica papaya]
MKFLFKFADSAHNSLMTSSVQDFSDNSESDEQRKQSESHIQSSPPAPGLAHPGITTPNVQYPMPPQLAGHAVAPGAYPYPDPYYRSIFAPYDAQPYPSQPYAGQPMVHLQLMGIQQAGVPLPSDAVEEPVFVNAKQYHGILRRRQSRAKAETENKAIKSRKPYLHESRHLHALRRARGCGGRFLNSKKNENQQNEAASGDKSQPSINLNSDKNDITSTNGTS